MTKENMLTSTSTRVSKLTEYTRPLTQESEISRNVKAGAVLDRVREGGVGVRRGRAM